MNTEVMNTESFLLNFKGVESVAISIIDLFLEKSDFFLEGIAKSISEKNPKNLELSAHTLKGAVATFQAERCHSLAYEIEKIGKAQSINGALDNFEELRIEVNKLNDYLRDLRRTIQSLIGTSK